MILRRCRRLLRSEEDAVDAMQDTFVQLLRNRERLRVERVAGLLITIATNICLNRLRACRRRPEDANQQLVQEIADMQEPEARLISRLRLARLWEGENVGTRAVAVLHFVDGLTLREVAQLTGLSVSGVRYRLRGLSDQLRALEEGAS
jgi:RNA polymerase sigma-70 factor (ECF subfamily)